MAVRKKKAASGSKKMIYYFGKTRTDGRAAQKPLLGGKGCNLADMTGIGLPVPPGFTITTEVCDEVLRGIGRQAPPEGLMKPRSRVASGQDPGKGTWQEVR